MSDQHGREWFEADASLPSLALGVTIAIPVDGGSDWFELGTITAGWSRDDGTIAYAISPAKGTRFVSPEAAQTPSTTTNEGTEQ